MASKRVIFVLVLEQSFEFRAAALKVRDIRRALATARVAKLDDHCLGFEEGRHDFGLFFCVGLFELAPAALLSAECLHKIRIEELS